MMEQGALHFREAQSYEDVARRERSAIAELRDEAFRRGALVLLAEKLQDGVPCPLCGSIEHLAPFHPGSAATVELEAIEKELDRVEQSLRTAEERRRQIENANAKSESALEHLELDIEQRERGIESARAAIADLLKKVDPDDPVAGATELRSRIDAVTTRGLAVRAMVEEIEVTASHLERDLTAAEQARNAAAERRASLQSALGTREERRGEIERAVADLRSRFAEELNAFARRSNGRTLEAAEAALREMHQHDRQVEELRDTIRERQNVLRSNKAKLAEIEQGLHEIGKRKLGMEGEQRSLEADVAEMAERLGRRWNELVPEVERGVAVEMLIRRREELRDRIKHEYEDAKARYDAIGSDAHVLRERVDSTWNLRCREERDRDMADKECRAALADHGFQSIADAEDAMLTGEQLRAHRDDAERIEGGLQRVRQRLAELRAEIAGRTIADTEVAALEAEMLMARKGDEEAIRSLGVAQERLRECREKNTELKNVSRQDMRSIEEQATADQLSRYLRGNGFIDFLANERLAEICRRASMQLDRLTSGRFELDSRPKDGFIIRDNGNGGGERSPSSLSGGETFLVSLSLAIALSDTIQLGHAPLEFFFLDEGFGTLDSDLLETVMNTLDRLRSEHRAIGVISHVAQLRERISRRLIVTPASEMDGSMVSYEMG